MPHLHLPAEYDERDLALAAALARTLRSSELYVAWRPGERWARPVTLTACEEPARPRPHGLKRLFRRTG